AAPRQGDEPRGLQALRPRARCPPQPHQASDLPDAKPGKCCHLPLAAMLVCPFSAAPVSLSLPLSNLSRSSPLHLLASLL
ncbi:unnamed protein product, partial [Closterium sp. NIES-53]